MNTIVIHNRRADWYPRLLRLVDFAQDQPFKYGDFDCALWGAAAWNIQVEDDYDVASRWRGKYKTLAGGLKLIKKAGYSDYVDVYAKELPSIPGSMCQSGDLAVVRGIDDMPSIGVVVKHIIYAPTLMGMGVLELTQALRGFAIGRDPNAAE